MVLLRVSHPSAYKFYESTSVVGELVYGRDVVPHPGERLGALVGTQVVPSYFTSPLRPVGFRREVVLCPFLGLGWPVAFSRLNLVLLVARRVVLPILYLLTFMTHNHSYASVPLGARRVMAHVIPLGTLWPGELTVPVGPIRSDERG